MRILLALAAVVAIGPGCAAWCPVNGYRPDEVSGHLTAPIETRDHNRTIDLSRLVQPRPQEYLIGPGDTLGVYVESVLGEEEKDPVVIAPATERQQPRLGFPIVVDRTGTISLPQAGEPIAVAGLPVREIERLVRTAYEDPESGLLKPGQGRVIVQLQAPRTTRVMVVRRDRTDPTLQQQAPTEGRTFTPPQGSSRIVELQGFDNDVMHALAATGGLPGPSAENAVYIMRASRRHAVAAMPAKVRPATPTPAKPKTDPTRLPQPNEADANQNASGIVPAGFVFGDRSSASRRAMPQTPCDGFACDAGPFDAVGCDSFAVVAGPPLSRQAVAAVGGGHSVLGSSARGGSTSGPHVVMSQPIVTGHSPFAPRAEEAARVLLSESPLGVSPVVVSPQPGLATGCSETLALAQSLLESPHVVRIPLETPCGSAELFDASDVVLHDGDVVFIEAREREFFYTAGLLGGGKYALPRGESLDVLDAIALVDAQRRPVPGKFVGGVSSMSQDVTIGASKLVIYRRSGAGTVPIELNLNRVKRNPAQAITIRPGDRLMLQYTPIESVAASFERHFLEGGVLGISSALAFGN